MTRFVNMMTSVRKRAMQQPLQFGNDFLIQNSIYLIYFAEFKLTFSYHNARYSVYVLLLTLYLVLIVINFAKLLPYVTGKYKTVFCSEY